MTVSVLFYQPATVTNADNNGGRMSSRLFVASHGGAGNFSTVSSDEQVSGVTQFRKVFVKVADSLNGFMPQLVIFLSKPSLQTDSRAFLVKGTQRDTQVDMDTRRYATGILNAAITAGDTVLVVDFEEGSGADLVVQVGDRIAIVEGSTENKTVVYAADVTWSTDQATIALTAGVSTDFTISAAVASCIVDTTNVNTAVDNIVKSFSTSAFDETAYPILTNNIGTDEETILLTISGATAFTVLSDSRGALPDGSTVADYSPMNVDFALPLFTISAAAWSGVHTVGEAMQFQIHPAAVSVWMGQETFAGATDESDALYLAVRS